MGLRVMGVYLLTRNEPTDYDEVAGFVVAAPDEETARAMVHNAAESKAGYTHRDDGCSGECRTRYDEWLDPRATPGPCYWLGDHARCERIGYAAEGVEAGIQLRSFRAS